ncbi:MAG: fructose-1,6-bisphosphatase [Aerococcus sp.]|nr:fructose-1,6-bisphosphatase [Aerococcus sp.]
MAVSNRYLTLLSEKFPTSDAVITEIINLEAILELPKGTEHFITDLHGEYEAVHHVLRNGSGRVKEKINDCFQDTLTANEKAVLATVIYYPEEKLPLIKQKLANSVAWTRFLEQTLLQLVDLARFAMSKYTRSKVRKEMPKQRAYVMEELLFTDSAMANKENYYRSIVENVIALGSGERLIKDFSDLICDLVVDHLHVVGDIYDRGPAPERIMDLLMQERHLDIQWGNHDIIWMAAASGSQVMIANVLRICARYDNLSVPEEAYGISLRPLVSFVEATYPDDGVAGFEPKERHSEAGVGYTSRQLAKMQQALAIIQFKLEALIIQSHPEFHCEDRLLLDKINYDTGTITLDGKTHTLINTTFPTIEPSDPYRLTDEERAVMDYLQHAFLHAKLLQQHVAFLYEKGSMYHCYNHNLLYHGCVPLNEDGTLMSLTLQGKTYEGKALFDQFERLMRQMWSGRYDEKAREICDYSWYLWQGEGSPLFGKQKMATFERYYLEDPMTHSEPKNAYYHFREQRGIVAQILEAFDMNPTVGHIINGHTPVKTKKGESPIKAGGRLLVIDGGFSKAYQETTGVAGYTLISNSYGLQLVTHQPFLGVWDAVINETDIISTERIVSTQRHRTLVRDTDIGQELSRQIDDLKDLLEAFSDGRVLERRY